MRYYIYLGDALVGLDDTPLVGQKEILDDWMKKVPQSFRFRIYREIMSNPRLLRVQDVEGVAPLIAKERDNREVE